MQQGVATASTGARRVAALQPTSSNNNVPQRTKPPVPPSRGSGEAAKQQRTMSSGSSDQALRPNKVRVLERSSGGSNQGGPEVAVPPPLSNEPPFLTEEDIESERFIVLALAKQIAQLKRERELVIHRREGLEGQYIDLKGTHCYETAHGAILHKRELATLGAAKAKTIEELKRQELENEKSTTKSRVARDNVDAAKKGVAELLQQVRQSQLEEKEVEKSIATTHQAIQKYHSETEITASRIAALDQKKRDQQANKASLEMDMKKKQAAQQDAQEVFDSKVNVVKALESKITELSRKRKGLGLN